MLFADRVEHPAQSGHSKVPRVVIRFSVAGFVWCVFVCWFLLVMRGPAVLAAVRAVAWLTVALGCYVALLSYWIVYNKALYALGATPQPEQGEEAAFEKDYFGRPLAVEAHAELEDQYLVMELDEEKKLYRAPNSEEMAARIESEHGDDLLSLAAAAGAAVAPAGPAPAQVRAGDAGNQAADEAEGQSGLRSLAAAAGADGGPSPAAPVHEEAEEERS